MFISKAQFTVLFTSLCLTSSLFAQILDIDPTTVDAESWIILDPQSEQIIASHHEKQMRAPASLTKMMVGYLSVKALQEKKISLNQIVTVPNIVTTVASDESRLKLQPGQHITIQELISSLIIMSANDSALTLGLTLSGNLPQFIELMNDTAKDLGMSNTHFSNASGITMQDHYSSAEDLALLAQKIVKETPLYLGYSKQQTFSYGDIYHEATNILLKKDPSVDGLKTGYTQAAGYNLALTANRLDPITQQNRRLVVIVMGTASKQKRADVAETLMNIGFNYTQTKQLFNQEKLIAELPIVNGQKPFYAIKMRGDASYNTLSLLDSSTLLDAKKFDNAKQRFIIDPKTSSTLEPLKSPLNIEYRIEFPQQFLKAPLKQTAFTLAKVQVSQFGEQLYAIDVVEDLELEEANLWQKIIFWFKSWFTELQGNAAKAVIYQIPS